MICQVGDRAFAGRAVDLPGAIDPATVAMAVREGHATLDSGTTVAVLARTAGPLHERVGTITPETPIRPRTALAAAARSLGWTTPVDDDLARARERLACSEPASEADDSDPAALRRRLAETTEEVERLRERVAETRGRVRAADGEAPAGERADPADHADSLAEAVADLSEVETAAAAAREDHRAARTEARAARDRLRDRLRRRDAVANLEREARAHLVDRARPCYESALATVPGVACPAAPFDGPPDAMALAVARVGDLAAPVVLACDRFADASAAARWLDAPAIRLER